MVRGVYIALLFLCWAGTAVAQVQDSVRLHIQEDIERALEGLEPSDIELDDERLVHFLHEMAEKPVNINTAPVDMLLRVPGVNLKVARAIIAYRRENKPFERVDELKDVPGIGAVTLERIRPYVTAGRGFSLGRLLYTNPGYWTDGGRTEFFSRYQQVLEGQAGYRRPGDEGGYTGSPVKYYQRMRYRSSHLSLNLTQEKDPGEPLSGPVSFDHTSWHVALEDNGKLRRLVVGDYGLSFGQGLVLWGGGGFGKGREVTGADRNERGVTPYSSAQETDFLRGVAATYGERLQISGFYSYRTRTASVIRGDTVRFPAGSGYHRTLNERARRNNTRQELYGGRLRMELPYGLVGVTGYRTVFDKYIKAGNTPYSRHDFSGIHTATAGLDYNLMVGPTLVFGEAGKSLNGGYGWITGVESPVGSATDVTLAWRTYSKDFQSVLGSGFGELSGSPQNEEGIYLGVRHSLSKKVTVSGYIDQFRFPAPRFGTRQPTGGYDWLGVVDVRFSRHLQVYVQGRSKSREEEYESADSYGRGVLNVGNERRSSLRLHAEYRVNPWVRLRTRGEVVRFRKPGAEEEYGYLLYQDLRLTPSPQWTIDVRITVFDTESYDSRVYQFENDLLYVFSNKVLFDQGQRLYLLVNYEPFSFMEVWGKAGITIYEDRQVIGSGLNEIQGNQRSDIGIQVRLKI